MARTKKKEPKEFMEDYAFDFFTMSESHQVWIQEAVKIAARRIMGPFMPNVYERINTVESLSNINRKFAEVEDLLRGEVNSIVQHILDDFGKLDWKSLPPQWPGEDDDADEITHRVKKGD